MDNDLLTQLVELITKLNQQGQGRYKVSLEIESTTEMGSDLKRPGQETVSTGVIKGPLSTPDKGIQHV